jgi:preprotein translocase subunit SecA
MIRVDHPDEVYKTEAAKYRAVVREIEDCYQRGQPVLVGTTSIEKSERVSDMLTRRGIPHNVLNAKQHEREAHVIAQAGQKGQVTIATNMAGRGTDIVLGEGVAELGGLHIVGTERHEARRIDNQLRGRAGRQGDPGSSRFYLSLEDDLMKRFASDRVAGLMERLGLEEDVAIESKLVSRTIESAQQRVEGYNFDIRKRVVEYDDVINKQRETIYAERDKVLRNEDLTETVRAFLDQEIRSLADRYLEGEDATAWDMDGLAAAVKTLGLSGEGTSADELWEIGGRAAIEAHLRDLADARLEALEQEHGAETWSLVERIVLLRAIDSLWVEHLTELDDMRRGIGLRGYSGEDPLNAFKKEAFALYEELRELIRHQGATTLVRVNVGREEPAPPAQPRRGGAHGGKGPKSRGGDQPRPADRCPRERPCHRGRLGAHVRPPPRLPATPGRLLL